MVGSSSRREGRQSSRSRFDFSKYPMGTVWVNSIQENKRNRKNQIHTHARITQTPIASRIRGISRAGPAGRRRRRASSAPTRRHRRCEKRNENKFTQSDTYDERLNLGRVIPDRSELRADELVAIVERLAHRPEHRLVENGHQQEELGGDDGQGEIEIEQFTRLGVRRGRRDGVDEGDRGRDVGLGERHRAGADRGALLRGDRRLGRGLVGDRRLGGGGGHGDAREDGGHCFRVCRVCRSVLTRRGMPFGGAAHHRIARVPSPHSLIFPFAKALGALRPLSSTFWMDPISIYRVMMRRFARPWMQKKDASLKSFFCPKITVQWSF